MLLFRIRLYFKMKLLHFYPCLLAIIFQAIFASTFLNRDGVSLSTSKVAQLKRKNFRSKAKPIAGKLVWSKRLQSTKKKNNRAFKSYKDTVIRGEKPEPLINLLPKELVRIVIGYFDDDTYPFIVSAHSWLLGKMPKIAVDDARVYVVTDSEGIKGLNHSFGNINEDKCRYVEFDDPEWLDYLQFSSSHDGRYVFFRHSYKASAGRGRQTKRSIKWLTASDAPEDARPRCVALDDESSPYGLLSRDGQTLCSYSKEVNPVMHVYQIKEKTEKDSAALVKLELHGEPRAISGKGNRVMLEKAGQLEIHDIDKTESKLICRIDVNAFWFVCALNEDGSEAAFVKDNQLLIMEVDKVVGDKSDQPAILTVKAPKSIGWISKLMYNGEGKLHVQHDKDKVSLFDALTKGFICLEVPQEGQTHVRLAISPNAECIAIIQGSDGEEDGKIIYHVIVKRKLGRTDWRDLFGYEAEKDKCATRP